MPYDVVSLGEAMIEFCEQPGAAGLYRRGFGGDTSNTIVAAARQGARTAYVTAVGLDEFGDALLRFWRDEGIDCSGVNRMQNGLTGAYFVSYGPAGHRFSYLRRGSAASCVGPDDVPCDLIEQSRILHVSGVSQAISSNACDAVFRAIELARQAGVTVAYDTNLRLALWPLSRARGVINEALRIVDIALPSLDDAVQLTGLSEHEAIIDHYLSLGCRLVALKMGDKGAFVATPGQRQSVAACKVDLVDATAAGDTFNGAFLAELARGAEAIAAAEYANAAAAISTTRQGAAASIPTRAETERFLKQRAEAS